MKGIFWKSTIAALTTLIVSTAHAALTGPGFPAPGGTTFVGSGSPLQFSFFTPRQGTYTGFNPSAYSELYWGPTLVGVSMDSNSNIVGSEVMNLMSWGGNVANYQGSTLLKDGSNSITYTVTTFAQVQLFDAANNPINFVTGASVGASAPIVADVEAASGSGGFKWLLRMWANDNDGFGTGNTADVFSFHDGTSFGTLQSSFSGGFFSAPPAVPAPATLALLGLGLLGFGLRRKLA